MANSGGKRKPQLIDGRAFTGPPEGIIEVRGPTGLRFIVKALGDNGICAILSVVFLLAFLAILFFSMNAPLWGEIGSFAVSVLLALRVALPVPGLRGK